MKLVVGLVGRIASGKGEACKLLERKYGAEVYRFSDVLRDVLTRLQVPVTRGSLQVLGNCLRKAFGEDVLVKALQSRIEGSEAKVVVVDGIRYHQELEMVRSFPKNAVLYITAPTKLRFARCKKRGTRGEAGISYKEFLAAEDRWTERLVYELGAKSDFAVDNSGTLDEFSVRLREILDQSLRR